MRKSVRRSVVLLLVFALLFSNFTSASTAFASETGAAEENQLEEPADKQEEAVNQGTGEDEENSDSVGEDSEADTEEADEDADAVKEDGDDSANNDAPAANEDESEPGAAAGGESLQGGDSIGEAGTDENSQKPGEEVSETIKEDETETGEENTDTNKEDEANSDEAVDGADNAGSQDNDKEEAADPSQKDESDAGKSVDGTGDKNDDEQTPAPESSEQKKSENQPEQADKDAEKSDSSKKSVRKSVGAKAAETINLTVVYTIVFGYKENTATYGVQLWKEEDGVESPLANYAIPDTDYVTNEEGYVEISLKSTPDGTDNNGSSLTMKIPEGTRYTVEQKSTSNLNVDLSYIYSGDESGTVGEVEGILTSNTYCQFYNIMKQRVKIAKTDQNGDYVSGVTLQIVDDKDNVIEEWKTTGEEDEIYLLPATDQSAFDTPAYYWLKEVSYPENIVSGASPIQFRPLPSSPLSEDGQLIQYYSDNDKWEPVPRLSMTNIDKTKFHDLTIQMAYDDNGTKAVLNTKDGGENFGVQVVIKNLPLEYMNIGMDIDEAYVTSFGSSNIVPWASATRPSEKSTHIDNSSTDYSKKFFRRDSGKQTCYTSFIVWLRYDETFSVHDLPDGAEYEVKEVNIYNNNIPPTSPYGYFDIEADGNAKGTIAEADVSTTIKNILRTINLKFSKEEVFGYDDGRPFFLVFRSAINGMYESFNQTFTDRNGVEREFFKWDLRGTPYTYGLIPFRPEDGVITIKLPTAVHWFIDEYIPVLGENLDEYTYDDLLDDAFLRVARPTDLITVGTNVTSSGYYMTYYAAMSGSNRRTDFVLRYKNESRMIAFQKVDENGNPVSGAKMQILEKESGKVLDEWESDAEKPHVWNMAYMSSYENPDPDIHAYIPDMVYILRETEAPTGYTTAEDIEFKIGKHTGTTMGYREDGVDDHEWNYYYPYIDLGDGKETLVLQMADDFEGHDVEISKQDINGDEIAGAQMKITGKVSGASEEITPIEWTSEEGKTKTVNLKPGTYTLEEKAAPDSNVYVLATDITFTVDIEGNVTVNGESVDKITMVDEYAPHDVDISKTDLGGNEIAGAVITITGQEEGASEEMEEITFTTDGEAPHKVALKPGSYTLTETTVPDGYEKAESISFTIDIDGTIKVDGKEVKDSTFTMLDDYSTHVIKISKTDVGGKEIADAEITITGRVNGESEDIEEIRYTTDGEAPHEVELKPGTYTMTEVTAPEGFVKAESITFTVEVDGTVLVDGEEVTDSTVTMVDEYFTADVKISKTDVGGKEIAGAEITITGRADGESEDIEEISYTTDGKNPHEVKLRPGTYTMTEVTAPDGYEKAESITFTVDKDGVVKVDDKEVKDSTVMMVDEYSTHTVKISKTDVGGKEIADAEITITGRADGESEDIEKITYTTDGKAPHEVELKPGTYTMTEVTAPEGYVKAESITFTVKVDGTVLVGGEEVTDSTVTMVDEYFTADVKISKTDVGGKEIAGAEITITGRADGESEDIEEIKYTTDGKNPHEVKLRPGTYTMTEVTAPDGYEKAESITFTVDKDGVVKVNGREVKDSTVTMVDEYSGHTVKISKTDVGGKEIAGAVLVITGREEGSTEDIKEIRFTTDGKKPHEVTLKPGTYTLTEITAPDGYEKAESITFTVKVDGTVLVGGEEVTDSTVTMVDEYSGHTVKISKTDVGGKEIAGAVLVITGREEGSTEDIKEIRFTTDGKKPHEVTLKPGTYTLTEITAPDGYEKAESITFTVGVDGTVKVGDKDVKGTVTMVDKEKTTAKTTTKTNTKKTKGGRTGDESGVTMVLTVFALAAAGLAATLIRRRRRS